MTEIRIVRYFAICLSVFISEFTLAQPHMRIHHKGGDHSDVAIEQIDSITFANESDEPDSEVSLKGSWLCGDTEAGYYELLTFNDDMLDYLLNRLDRQFVYNTRNSFYL